MLPVDAAPERGLSVVVPCFNEQATVRELLELVLANPLTRQVVAVDDASTDETLEVLHSIDDARLLIVRHAQNRGKGAALRTGFAVADQPFVVVQDADLEYDPSEYGVLLEPLVTGAADVVYGSRFLGRRNRQVLYFRHTAANRFLTFASNLTTRLGLTDMETCYKMFRREVLDDLDLVEERFGFEPEFTAKVAARRWRVREVGISYNGRSFAQGKKIGWRDGVHAIYCIVAYSALGRALRLQRVRRVVARITGG